MSRELMDAISIIEQLLVLRGSLSLDEVTNLVLDETIEERALQFLRERNLILQDPSVARLYHRPAVERQLVEHLLSARTSTVEGLAAKLGVPIAILCDVVGSLECDGRLATRPSEGGFEIELR